MSSRPTLGIAPEELAACVACGLCLPHCPTFRVTGEEWASPRGRISAMRQVQDHGAPADRAFRESMETCVQCRGCEPACPSGVPFGSMMETTQAELSRQHRWNPRRWGFKVLGRPRLLTLLSRLLAVAQRLRMVPSKRLGLPRLPLHQERLQASGDDVWLFTGCVMDAWQRSVHAAVKRVVEATGTGVALPGAGAGCCGALSLHAGLDDHARTLAIRTMGALGGQAPILVDSAGCGAALKEYGKLLGTPEAIAFSRRVMDVHEWLATRTDRLPPAGERDEGLVIAVHDPCHLRHVQRAHEPVATVLALYTSVVTLDDDGLCCGAGGAYAAMQPGMAAAIRERKLEAIRRSGATVVASANPGCSIHLANAGVQVRHPLEIIDKAIRHS
ncbi:(Fe-S)-binding protein [Candidatus Poriferisocius sp.]|uniref:(Fe-S)-binding protein n=1 Tax=Candidatus Poriferisocius sp. TaxID=3101276 RepID=UPI003B021788